MKNFFFSFVLLSLLASSCVAQKPDWLRTDKKEFEKLFPLFDTIIRSDWYKELSVAPEDAVPDTLSVGTWKGVLGDASGGVPEEITMNISQTSPFVKGFLFFVNPSTDSGPDTTGGEFRGVRKDNRYLLIWQLLPHKDFLVFLEGNCFKEKHYSAIHSFIGNLAAENEEGLTKGNFFLTKE